MTKPLGVIDPEDLAIDPSNGHLFIANGTGNSSAGGPLDNSIVENDNTGTQIFPTVRLPSVIEDPEALAYEVQHDVL